MDSFACPNPGCNTHMEHRTGKYGGFWYCRQHGTISDARAVVVQKILDTARRSGGTTHKASPIDTTSSDLMFQIEKQTMSFGYQPSELEKWIVDSPHGIDDDEDHWMNVRPY
jgi:hypothetical protein